MAKDLPRPPLAHPRSDVVMIAQRIGVATDNKDPITLRDDIIRYVQTLLAEREDMLERVRESEEERRHENAG